MSETHMTQNLKLSLWDAFVFFLSGWAIMACVSAHLWACDFAVREWLTAIPPAALGVSALIVPLITGLLFEPVANRVMAFISYAISKCAGMCCAAKSTAESGSNPIVQAVKDDIPADISDFVVPYHWAKDYLSQETVETPYMAFLSKFGFYRNLGVLSLLNVLLIPCLYDVEKPHKIILSILVLATFLYLWRSHTFYNHLGDAMYRHYAIFRDRRERASNSQSET